MASVNKVFLLGNLTRDPELRYTANGAAVVSFGMAMNRKYKHDNDWKEETCFVDITVWGKQGENCAEYLNKGRSVFVEGRLNFRTWETEQGQRRSKLDVVANSVQFLSRSDKDSKSGAKPNDFKAAEDSNATEGSNAAPEDSNAAPEDSNAAPEGNAEPDVPF